MSDIRTAPSVTPQDCLNFASREITVEEAGHLGEEYLYAKFGVNHE